MCLFGNASVWAPTGVLGQGAIIFKAFLLIDLCLSGEQHASVDLVLPSSPLEVDV